MMKSKKIALCVILLLTFTSTFAESDSTRIANLEREITLLREYKTNYENVAKIEIQKGKEEIKRRRDERGVVTASDTKDCQEM